MPDPYAPAVLLGQPTEQERTLAKLSQRCSALEARCAALERAHVTAIALTSAGVPSFTPTQPGVIYLDTTGTRLGAYTPAGWKSVVIA